MRIVAFSDLHIHPHRFGATSCTNGRSSRLQHCLDVLTETDGACVSLGAKARLFCGDLFHVRGQLKPSILNPVLDHFRFERGPGYIDLMLPGNHDMEMRTDGEHALEALKPLPRMQVLDNFGYDVFELDKYTGADVGIGWVGYSPNVEELKQRVERVAAAKRVDQRQPWATVFMLHHGVDGAMPDIPNMGFSPAHLPTDDFDVVLCGDYHNHKQLAENAWMIGAPLQHTFGDAGQTRGFMVLDIEKGQKTQARLVEIPHVPKFVTWDSNGAAPLGSQLKNNFVRIRSDDETKLEKMRTIVDGFGPAAVQCELVRSMAAITRSNVTLSMKTSDLFVEWAKGRELPTGVTLADIVTLNNECLGEAGVV